MREFNIFYNNWLWQTESRPEFNYVLDLTKQQGFVDGHALATPLTMGPAVLRA